jgi:hypothetical protein
MNYSVKNQSEVSDAYTESAKQVQGTGTFSDIGAVRPVRYPNAQTVSVDPTEKLAKAQSVNRDMNEIASGFTGTATGYGSDSRSYSYQMIGSTIDLYA